MKHKRWTPKEVKYLVKEYPKQKLKVSEIAAKLGRTKPAVKQKIKKLGLPNNRVYWTPAKIEILKKYYPYLEAKLVGEKCQMSKISVYNKAHELGLKKSKEFLRQMASRLHESGKANRYQKGHVPANKGKKMDPQIKERIKHTFFKKGHTPHNTKSDGVISTRIDKNGTKYKFIRIARANWQEYHRYIWEQQNGKIPKGSNIIFINGDTLDCRIENLMMITNAELMKLNNIQRYPPELQAQMKKLKKFKKLLKSKTTKQWQN